MMINTLIIAIFWPVLLITISCSGRPSPTADAASSHLASISVGKYNSSESWSLMRVKVTDRTTKKDVYSKDLKYTEFGSDGIAESSNGKIPYGTYRISVRYYRVSPNAKERAAETLVYQNCDPDKEWTVNSSTVNDGKFTFEFDVCDKEGKQVGQTEGMADVIFKPIEGPKDDGTDPSQDTTAPPSSDKETAYVSEALSKIKNIVKDGSKFADMRLLLQKATESLGYYNESKSRTDKLVFCGDVLMLETEVLDLEEQGVITKSEKDSINAPLLTILAKGKICD